MFEGLLGELDPGVILYVVLELRRSAVFWAHFAVLVAR